MSDEWDFWRRAVEIGKGRRLTKDEAKSLAITTEPQTGYYRKRNKDGSDHAVAIWTVGGHQIATSNGRSVDPDDIWTWCCDWPVPYETYLAVVKDGQPWPDDPPVAEAVIGHNMPDDPHAALRLEFEAERELAERFLSKPVATQAEADQAAVWSKRIAAIAKKATDLHKVEKQPHLDAGRAVDDKWRPLKEEPDTLSKRLKRHLDAWLREQDRIEQERRRKAQEEAERIRREAEAAEHAARHADVTEDEEMLAARKAEAERLAEQAAEAECATVARNAQAGRTGAKVALRTFIGAEITDYDALLMALKDREEVRDLVQSLANRAAKAGVELPGMKITEERRAA